MSLALASRRAAISPAWVKNSLWRTARAVPSLDLRFADTKSLADAVTGQSLVTFTRASSGTYVGSDGLIKTAAVNEPRFDHNPTTGESLGLLVEEPRTNWIRNNTMVGAVAGTPGTLPTNWSALSSITGITAEIVGTGTSNGITYIDIKLAGTSSAASAYHLVFDANTAIAASTGQTWTSSSYVALVAGSFANIATAFLRCTERASGGSFVGATEVTISGITSNLSNNRIVVSRTLGATAAFVQGGIIVNVASGAAIDITLRIGLPQLEQGAFATSVIPTTGTTATRSADVASNTGAAFSSWYRQDEGTFYADVFRQFAVPATDFPVVADCRFGTGINQFSYLTEALAGTFVAVSGVTQSELYPVGLTGARNRRLAHGYAANNFAATANGSIPLTDTSGSVPTVSAMSIGSVSGNAQFLNGTIRRLTFWPQRLPNSTLQALTQ